ncbi:protein lifeguard 2 isoform 3-T3 [Rhinophrynus dorsalis]
MTQGKVSVSNKGGENGSEHEEIQKNNMASSSPPSYEETVSRDGKYGGFLQTNSSMMNLPTEPREEACKSPSCSSGVYSEDTEMLTALSWEDGRVRRGFIRKVYSILMIQLLITVAVVALFTFCEPVKDYVQANPAWYWASYSGLLYRTKTLSMAYLTGMLSSYYNTKSVILCLGITALVCLSVTLFSFQTKVDITSFQGILFALVMVLLFSGIFLFIVIPFQYVPWLHAVYAVLGAIVFTMFLAFDTQMLMGSRRYSLSPEEYIFGALNIYLDIINIFSFLLQLFGNQE